MKYIIGGLCGAAVLAVIIVLFLMVNKPVTISDIPETSKPQVVTSPTSSATISASPSNGGGVETAIISGKLCYPSEILPAGAIEAKNTINDTLVTQEYIGSENGGTSEFSISVPSGTYILRYKAGTLYGYSTDVCTTGLETTCAQDNQREHNHYIVQAGGEVKNVNLCDFYYSETTDPGF